MTAHTQLKHALPIALAALLAPGLGAALEIGGTGVTVQPRAEAGIMQFSTTEGAYSYTNPNPGVGEPGNDTGNKVTFEATLPTLGGGLTLFADRFFLDLSAQQTAKASADDGHGSSGSAFYPAAYVVGGRSITGFQGSTRGLDLDVDRSEYAISAGYALTDQIALYAGYKWAKTRFKGRGEGTYEYIEYYPSGGSLTFGGSVETLDHYTYEHDGPFVGVVYGLGVERGILSGRLSFNFAAALLDGDFQNTSKWKWSQLTVNGEPAEQIDTYLADLATETDNASSGETVGLTFGVSWNGRTSIEGLSYSLGVSGYSYEFDKDDADDSSVTETALMFKTGISYAF